MTMLDSTSIMQDRVALPAAQDVNSRIATRVRALRTDLGMTLDALAAKCAVSRSMISRAWREQPHGGRAGKDRLGTRRAARGVVRRHQRTRQPGGPPRRPDTVARSRAGYVRRNISPANFPSPIQIVEVLLPAGASVAYETGARDVSIHQQIWVQEGTIEVTLGHATHRLSEDDCLAMQLNEPTAFRNRTRRAARYIVIVATERSRASRR
jgi:hypothetical protein